MLSLLNELDDGPAAPAVGAFLDAVDTVMNSNTFLLKVRADAPVTGGDRAEVLSAFLRDPLFEEMMLTVDRGRGWWNLQDGDGPLVVDGPVRPDVRELGAGGFWRRLRWMLREAFSPYGRRLDDEAAGAVLGPLPEALFGGDEAGWSFCEVRPDFLRGTGYYSGAACAGLAYFDGGESDTATFFYRGDVFYLLLTNGSP